MMKGEVYQGKFIGIGNGNTPSNRLAMHYIALATTILHNMGLLN